MYEKNISPALSDSVHIKEVLVESVEENESILIGFNGEDKHLSEHQPVLIADKDGVLVKEAGLIEIGDILVVVGSDGAVKTNNVFSIERDTKLSKTYDIKISQHSWFITENFVCFI